MTGQCTYAACCIAGFNGVHIQALMESRARMSGDVDNETGELGTTL